MVVKYLNYRDCKTFYIFLKDLNGAEVQYDFRDCPSKFVIDKHPVSEADVRYTFRMVTDTINNQFRCIDYLFLEKYRTVETKKSFENMSDIEKEMFIQFQKIVSENIEGLNFNKSNISAFLGWVRVGY